jgi:hypothetical protein
VKLFNETKVLRRRLGEDWVRLSSGKAPHHILPSLRLRAVEQREVFLLQHVMTSFGRSTDLLISNACEINTWSVKIFPAW